MSATASLANPSLMAQHQRNMALSLKHRLESARMAQNAQLIRALEQEQQHFSSQLVAPAFSERSHPSLFETLWNGIAHFWSSGSTLEVRQIHDQNGLNWWYAHEPRTGASVYTDSEAELMAWIESHHWAD